MVVFRLTIFNKSSRNVSRDNQQVFVSIKKDNEVPKEVINIGQFTYRWSDGVSAIVTVTKMYNNEANALKKKYCGFNGYEWMIKSIINHGYIVTPKEDIEENGTNKQKYILRVSRVTNTLPINDKYEHLNVYLTYKNIQSLGDNDLIKLDDELYDGGPTVNDILKFMVKYKNYEWYLIASFKDMKVTYKAFKSGCYYTDNYKNQEIVDALSELDIILKDVKKINALGETLFEFNK